MSKQPKCKYLILSDIHSNYLALKHLKSLPEYSNSQIIFAGDYVDGFKIYKGEVENTLNFIYEETKNGAIALMGNHEKYLLDYLDGNNSFWLSVGGKDSCISLGVYDYGVNALKEKLKPYLSWLKALPNVYENKNLVVVHAGFDLLKSIEEQKDSEDCYLIRKPYYEIRCFRPKLEYQDKIIVTGHTPNPIIKENVFDIILDKRLGTRYFIDGASNGSKTNRYGINVLILDENFNFEKAYKLNEKGYIETKLVDYEKEGTNG